MTGIMTEMTEIFEIMASDRNEWKIATTMKLWLKLLK